MKQTTVTLNTSIIACVLFFQNIISGSWQLLHHQTVVFFQAYRLLSWHKYHSNFKDRFFYSRFKATRFTLRHKRANYLIEWRNLGKENFKILFGIIYILVFVKRISFWNLFRFNHSNRFWYLLLLWWLLFSLNKSFRLILLSEAFKQHEIALEKLRK